MVIDLHAKNQVSIYKRLEKKSGKLFDLNDQTVFWTFFQGPQFCKKSMERKKIQTRSVSLVDLHAKNQVNICKRLEKNCLIAQIYLVQSPSFRQKLMERYETQTRSVSHGD